MNDEDDEGTTIQPVIVIVSSVQMRQPTNIELADLIGRQTHMYYTYGEAARAEDNLIGDPEKVEQLSEHAREAEVSVEQWWQQLIVHETTQEAQYTGSLSVDSEDEV